MYKSCLVYERIDLTSKVMNFMDYCEYKDFKKYYRPGAKLIKFNEAKVGDILQRESTTMIKLYEENKNFVQNAE